MSHSSLPTETPPAVEQPQKYFAYRPGTDGVDKTFNIYCLDTECTVATFNFWEARDKCRRWARKLTAALNALYQNGGHVRTPEFVTTHEYLTRKYCRSTIVHHLTGEPLIACFDDYEIHGVRRSAEGLREHVSDEEAQFWSLSGYCYADEDRLELIGDYATRELAKDIYTRITGWFYRPRWRKDASSSETPSTLFPAEGCEL